MTVHTFDSRSPEAASRGSTAFWPRSLAGSVLTSGLAPLCAWLALHATYLLIYPVFLTGFAYVLGVLQGRSSNQPRRDWLWGSATALTQLLAWALPASLLSDAGVAWLSVAGVLPLCVVPAAAVVAVHRMLLKPPIDLSFLQP